jgi:hypothetical protein
MSYCAVKDVETLMPQDITFTTTSRPTIAQVSQQIDFVAEEMDALLRGLYVLPIFGTKSIRLLAYINALGTAANIDMPIEMSSGETDRSAAKVLRTQYNEKMESLRVRKLVLPDTTQLTNVVSVKVVNANDETAFTNKSLDSFIRSSKVER